jgi:hypothetical protein
MQRLEQNHEKIEETLFVLERYRVVIITKGKLAEEKNKYSRDVVIKPLNKNQLGS